MLRTNEKRRKRDCAKTPTAYFATSTLCKIHFDRVANNKKLRQMNNSNSPVAGAPMMENGNRRAIRRYVRDGNKAHGEATQTQLASPVT